MQNTKRHAQIADFVQRAFPKQYLIPVADFAKLTSESYGGCRNRISLGTFELDVVKRGKRNFVAIIDVIDHLVAKEEAELAEPAECEVENERDQEPKPARRSKYGEAAKARAAAAREAKRLARAGGAQ